MKLYYFPGACSLATRIVLHETNTDFTSEKVDVAAGKTESGIEYKTINPKGYVPFLSIGPDIQLSEGTVILSYLADQHPDLNLAPTNGSMDRLKFQEFLAFLSTEIHKSFTPLFVYPKASDEQRQLFIKRLKSKVKIIDDRLSDGREFLFGDQFTITDAYALVILGWHNFVKVDFSDFPHIQAYLERMSKRSSVQTSLKEEGLAA